MMKRYNLPLHYRLTPLLVPLLLTGCISNPEQGAGQHDEATASVSQSDSPCIRSNKTPESVHPFLMLDNAAWPSPEWGVTGRGGFISEAPAFDCVPKRKRYGPRNQAQSLPSTQALQTMATEIAEDLPSLRVNSDDTRVHLSQNTPWGRVWERRRGHPAVAYHSSRRPSGKSQVQRSGKGDLWDRVRLGFRLEIPDRPRVRDAVARLAANPDSLKSGVKRAEPYLHFIVEETERRGMPLELALLPAVESGFSPSAKSPKAAMGLWQFMPATAREMGLKKNAWYEGRCDITASTRAALDYLQSLADQFDGDWELALAAYNAGPGTVQQAIRSNQEKGLATDFWSLSLPGETRSYVPKLLAIAEVMGNPDAHGLDLKPIANRPYFSAVDLPYPLDLKQAAKLAQVDPATINKLNPGLIKGTTGPAGDYALLLPVKQAAQFEQRLAHLDPQQQSISTEQKYDSPPVPIAAKGPLSPPTKMARGVQRGESLTKIAHAYRIDPARLAAWNHSAPKAQLQSGRTLHAYPVDLNVGGPFIYEVRKGDSLHGIARRFNVSVADLRRWNHVDDDNLRPGRRLTLLLTNSLTSSI